MRTITTLKRAADALALYLANPQRPLSEYACGLGISTGYARTLRDNIRTYLLPLLASADSQLTLLTDLTDGERHWLLSHFAKADLVSPYAISISEKLKRLSGDITMQLQYSSTSAVDILRIGDTAESLDEVEVKLDYYQRLLCDGYLFRHSRHGGFESGLVHRWTHGKNFRFWEFWLKEGHLSFVMEALVEQSEELGIESVDVQPQSVCVYLSKPNPLFPVALANVPIEGLGSYEVVYQNKWTLCTLAKDAPIKRIDVKVYDPRYSVIREFQRGLDLVPLRAFLENRDYHDFAAQISPVPTNEHYMLLLNRKRPIFNVLSNCHQFIGRVRSSEFRQIMEGKSKNAQQECGLAFIAYGDNADQAVGARVRRALGIVDVVEDVSAADLLFIRTNFGFQYRLLPEWFAHNGGCNWFGVGGYDTALSTLSETPIGPERDLLGAAILAQLNSDGHLVLVEKAYDRLLSKYTIDWQQFGGITSIISNLDRIGIMTNSTPDGVN